MPTFTVPFTSIIALSGALTIETDTAQSAYDLAKQEIEAVLHEIDLSDDFTDNSDDISEAQLNHLSLSHTTIDLASIKPASDGSSDEPADGASPTD